MVILHSYIRLNNKISTLSLAPRMFIYLISKFIQLCVVWIFNNSVIFINFGALDLELDVIMF